MSRLSYLLAAIIVLACANVCMADGNTEERDVTVFNKRDGICLAGTLSYPASGKPRAAIVLASGSGQQDRDETIMGHRPFRTIAEGLSSKGYAVLRMDDRGIGGSGGDFSESTTDDFVTDISAAVCYLDSCLGGSVPVGVLGHSEGGTVAVKTAVTNGLCRFIVTLAGPAWSGDSIIMSQARAIATAMTGRWDNEASQRRLLDIVKSDMPGYMANAQLALEIGREYGEGATIPQVKEQIGNAAALMTSPWYRAMVRYNPEDDIRRVAVPWLALNGSKDLQVLPGNLETIRELNPKATTVELEGHNHMFQKCVTGLMQEYATLQGDISDETIDAIVSWLDRLD